MQRVSARRRLSAAATESVKSRESRAVVFMAAKE
jgi:hypothetical protein